MGVAVQFRVGPSASSLANVAQTDNRSAQAAGVGPAASPGLVHRVIRSLGRSKSEQHAQNLRSSTPAGSTSICDCEPGERTTITGVLHSVTLRPREGVPAVEAELFDGTGKIMLVWLGRRRIRGIEPGRGLTVTGRVTCNTAKPTIFNPKYDLQPMGVGH